jgi:hypothetical protein
VPNSFEIIGSIHGIEIIASGHGIRDLAVLQKHFGRGNWRKVKGFATVRLAEVGLPRPRFIGTKHTESGGAGPKSSTTSTNHERFEALRHLHQ